MTHLTFLSSNAGKAKRKSTFQNVLTCENGTRMAGKRQVNGSLGSRYSLDSILSRFCLASLICAPKVLNHRARVLGRFALPEHLSFSKPKVNWLLHIFVSSPCLTGRLTLLIYYLLAFRHDYLPNDRLCPGQCDSEALFVVIGEVFS